MTDAKIKNIGFTLIELMIVVAILGILATVAIVSYNRYIEKSKNSEAISILADIRIKQESYRSTFHQYANAGVGEWLPDDAPGASARLWDATATGADEWRQLGVKPDHNVYFSYTIAAGAPGSTPAAPFAGLGINATNDFWFAAQALQDLDDDGKCAGFEIYTGQGAIINLNEGDVNCP